METKKIEDLSGILKTEKAERIFLVVDKNSYEVSGAEAALKTILESYIVHRFDDFESNPKIEDVQKGIGEFNEFKPDTVVAIGGGSVMDMGKLVNSLSQQDGNIEDYVTGKEKVKDAGKSLVAIPTTAGTGAEATQFAVVYIGKAKHSLEHQFVLPSHSILDAQFTLKLPSSITASTGMDALSQSLEAYWNVRSTEEAKQYAKEAIELTLANLSDVVNQGTEESRIAMLRAANLSGKAINITKTTACHSVSYPITSYFNIPHGHACALTLAEVLLFNSEVDEKSCTDKRGVAYVKGVIEDLVNLFGANDAVSAKAKIENLMKEIHLETRLSKLGITSTEIIVKNGFNPQRIENNPRRIDEDDLRKILSDIL